MDHLDLMLDTAGMPDPLREAIRREIDWLLWQAEEAGRNEGYDQGREDEYHRCYTEGT